MNERIKLLAEQAMTATTSKFSANIEWSADEWRDFYDKKFAQLLIQECITNLEVHTTCFDGDVGRGIKTAARLTKEHFGL